MYDFSRCGFTKVHENFICIDSGNIYIVTLSIVIALHYLSHSEPELHQMLIQFYAHWKRFSLEAMKLR